MPKFLAVNVIVKTYETYAQTEDEGHENIRKWQESESEEPEGGVKAITHKLGWYEFKMSDQEIIEGRDRVLASFLGLMGNLPNTPKPKPVIDVQPNNIIKCYDPFPGTKPVLPCSKIERIVQDITKDIYDEPRRK